MGLPPFIYKAFTASFNGTGFSANQVAGIGIGGNGQRWLITTLEANISLYQRFIVDNVVGAWVLVKAFPVGGGSVSVTCADRTEYGLASSDADPGFTYTCAPIGADDSDDAIRVFYPDGSDRESIQSALDAAEAAGGGVVQLGYGTYTITTVDSPASGDKAAGAYGIEIPSNVTLQGMGDSTVLSIVAGGVFGVGVAISPKGMRTATADADGFGVAANDVILRDFKIMAAAQDPASGNLINLVHANRWLIERVHIAGSYYHGIEIDQSRKITFRRCRISGAYTGISGTWLQFDYGLAGPVNRPASITTRLVEDVLFDECEFEQRATGESASARDIELTHEGTVLQLNRITFRRCRMTGRNQDFVSIADIGGGNTGGSVNELLFDECTFITAGVKSYAFYMIQNLGMTFRGIRFRGCEFTGPSATFIAMGGSTSASYNATHAYRHEGEITNCRFLFDKTQMPVSFDMNLVVANAWSSFNFSDNYIEGIGNFPVSVGTTYCRLALINNNLLTRVCRNRANWKGTGTFAVGCTGFIIDISLADQAATTQGLYVEDNSLYSDSGTGWSYGIFVTTGSSAPANRALAYSGNFSNLATTTTNNVIMTGTNSSGSITSGGIGSSVRNVTGNTTLTPSDFIVNCDTTSGTITVTAAAALARRAFILIKTNAANTLTCGATSVTAVGAGILVYTDGTTIFTKSLN